jgi:hypothetical protein
MPSQRETRAIGVYEFMDRCFRHGAQSVTMLPHDRFAVRNAAGEEATVRVRTSSYPDWQDGLDQVKRGDYDAMVLVNIADPERMAFARRDAYQQRIAARHDRFLAGHNGRRPRTPGSDHTAVGATDVADWIGDWTAIGL